MPVNVDRILLILADGTHDAIDAAKRRYADTAVSLLVLDNQSGTELAGLPDKWERVRLAGLTNSDALRRDFLEFLDTWPTQPIWKGKGFDDLFRRPGGYSVWWTGPGLERHPNSEPFCSMRALWLMDRAIIESQRPIWLDDGSESVEVSDIPSAADFSSA
ncbi:MAG: hypothetical protein IH991_00830, partial [Planctomycetes bacterium]|nr:hypothetical protein [Planctomycetota bacterium]